MATITVTDSDNNQIEFTSVYKCVVCNTDFDLTDYDDMRSHLDSNSGHYCSLVFE